MPFPAATLGKELVVQDTRFHWVSERRAMTHVYQSGDQESFLRMGPASVIRANLEQHSRLSKAGIPLPEVTWSGTLATGYAYIERSLGREHYGDIISREQVASRKISDSTFQHLLDLTRALHSSAAKLTSARDWNSLREVANISNLKRLRPDFSQRLEQAWDKMAATFAALPWVFTHGDFTPFNIFPKGIIDLEDAHYGPLGYDLASLMSTHAWFPDNRQIEFFRLYAYSPSQQKAFFDLAAQLYPGRLTEDVYEIIEAQSMLRGMWACVLTHHLPKLQEFRFELMDRLLRFYVCGRPISQELWAVEVQ